MKMEVAPSSEEQYENVYKSYEVLIQPEAQSQFRQIWLPVQQGFRLVEISPGQGINQITIPSTIQNQPQIINLTNQNQTQIINIPGRLGPVSNKNSVRINQSITSGGTSGSTVSSAGTGQSVDVKTEVGTDDVVSLMENDAQPSPVPNRAAAMKKVIARPTKKAKIISEPRPKIVPSSPVSSPAVSEISSRASNPGEIGDLTDFTIPMGEDIEVVENETQVGFQSE